MEINLFQANLFHTKLISNHYKLLSIQRIKLSHKINLLFTKLPTLEEYLALHIQIKEHKNTGEWHEYEEILLQFVALGTNPECIKNRFDWRQVQMLMPLKRSIKQLYFRFQRFYLPKLKRIPWTKFEDQLLYDIVNTKRSNKWKAMAQEYNELSRSCVRRSGKQCRERWKNKLDPKINRNPMSLKEESEFLRLLLQYGKKWSKISYELQKLSNNTIRTEFQLKFQFLKLQSKEKQQLQGPSDDQINSNQIIHFSWSQKMIDKIIFRQNIIFENIKRGLETQNYLFQNDWDNNLSLMILKKGWFISLSTNEL